MWGSITGELVVREWRAADLHFHARELARAAERLIHQQELRAMDQGAAQRTLCCMPPTIARIGLIEAL